MIKRCHVHTASDLGNPIVRGIMVCNAVWRGDAEIDARAGDMSPLTIKKNDLKPGDLTGLVDAHVAVHRDAGIGHRGDGAGVAAAEPLSAITGKSHNGTKSPELTQIGSITNIATAAFDGIALAFTDRTYQLRP